MNIYLAKYTDLMLSINIGNNKGQISISKPLLLLSMIDAIEGKELKSNKIEIDNKFLRNQFGKYYELIYKNRKGYEIGFFLRPYFHLCCSDFYHLVWKVNGVKIANNRTPSAKYLRENMQYAKLDDELWELLQKVENREFFKKHIIDRFLTKQQIYGNKI